MERERERETSWDEKRHGADMSGTRSYKTSTTIRLLFENRPALYFLNYIFISAYKIYFLFRIKDTVSDILSVLLNFIANYDSKNENIPPYCL